jgi:hypothetical protein
VMHWHQPKETMNSKVGTRARNNHVLAYKETGLHMANCRFCNHKWNPLPRQKYVQNSSLGFLDITDVSCDEDTYISILICTSST